MGMPRPFRVRRPCGAGSGRGAAARARHREGPRRDPDERLVLRANGLAYQWILDDPATVVTPGTVGDSELNSALTLRYGTRYEIESRVSGTHPFAFMIDGGEPEQDAIALTQAGSPALEDGPGHRLGRGGRLPCASPDAVHGRGR